MFKYSSVLILIYWAFVGFITADAINSGILAKEQGTTIAVMLIFVFISVPLFMMMVEYSIRGWKR